MKMLLPLLHICAVAAHITAMSTFNEADHPRVANGQFTDGPQSAPEVALPVDQIAAAAVDALAREFLEQISAVPPEQRRLFTSDKFSGVFAGPIGSASAQRDE